MTVSEPRPPEVQMAARATGIVPYIAAGAMFMENLDSTVIVTALPAMALDFGVSTTSASLGISMYLLAVAVFLP